MSPEIWEIVGDHFQGSPASGDDGFMHVNTENEPFNLLADSSMHNELLGEDCAAFALIAALAAPPLPLHPSLHPLATLLATPLAVRPESRRPPTRVRPLPAGYNLISDSSAFLHDVIRVPLCGYVHDTARELLEGGNTHFAERRSIVTCFAMILGLDDAIHSGAAGLPAIQACLEATMETMAKTGGLLRQFMLDDKGVVCIWNFGLCSNVFEDSAARGLQSAMDVSPPPPPPQGNRWRFCSLTRCNLARSDRVRANASPHPLRLATPNPAGARGTCRNGARRSDRGHGRVAFLWACRRARCGHGAPGT